LPAIGHFQALQPVVGPVALHRPGETVWGSSFPRRSPGGRGGRRRPQAHPASLLTPYDVRTLWRRAYPTA
jgi:hypothetical protein